MGLYIEALQKSLQNGLYRWGLYNRVSTKRGVSIWWSLCWGCTRAALQGASTERSLQERPYKGVSILWLYRRVSTKGSLFWGSTEGSLQSGLYIGALQKGLY